MDSEDVVSSDSSGLYKWVIKGTLSPVDVEAAIAYFRKQASHDESSELNLCNALLCSNDPVHHSEAAELARKNIDGWGRYALFRMYFNGIGVERDIKAALHVFNSGDEIRRRKSAGL